MSLGLVYEYGDGCVILGVRFVLMGLGCGFRRYEHGGCLRWCLNLKGKKSILVFGGGYA